MMLAKNSGVGSVMFANTQDEGNPELGQPGRRIQGYVQGG